MNSLFISESGVLRCPNVSLQLSSPEIGSHAQTVPSGLVPREIGGLRQHQLGGLFPRQPMVNGSITQGVGVVGHGHPNLSSARHPRLAATAITGPTRGGGGVSTMTSLAGRRRHLGHLVPCSRLLTVFDLQLYLRHFAGFGAGVAVGGP